MRNRRTFRKGPAVFLFGRKRRRFVPQPPKNDFRPRAQNRDFGGIRIEDDILVTESGSRIIGDRKIPVTVEELEGLKSLF